MKKLFLLILLLSVSLTAVSQDYDAARISSIQNGLEAMQVDIPGLTENINIQVQQATLPTFLSAISEVHNINLDVSPELASITIINNFKQVSVTDVLVYLCKLHKLEIDQTGNILYVKRFVEAPVEPKEKIINLTYSSTSDLLKADLQNDLLSEVFKLISEKTGKGLFYTPGLANKTISGFYNDLKLETALEKMAFTNNLLLTKTKDGTFEFTDAGVSTDGNSISRPARSRRSNFYFEVLDSLSRRIRVDFENVPIEDIVYDIGNALNLNLFTANPLNEAGFATVKTDDITFDALLTKIFESNSYQGNGNGTVSNVRGNQGNSQPQGVSSNFSFKKKDNVYYFGKVEQLVLRTAEVVPMYYRPIILLPDPQSGGRSVGRTVSVGQGFDGISGFNSSRTNNFQNERPQASTNQPSEQGSDLLSILPDDLKEGLTITIDEGLNSFVISGPNDAVLRFKNFVKEIDKPVPMVLIEVMILEIGHNINLDLGVEWGIGTEPTETQGNIFPNTDLNLGATTVNRILGRIDGSSFFNIGTVVPNFFARIKASESNGNFKIKSSPRIATMNGHRAYFSNGQTTYYEVERQSIIGVQNPLTNTITNFAPADAELSLNVKPFIATDGEITMDLKVIQSTFSGTRISEGAPPDLTSREFTSVVKARNNDIIVLGGLEESSKNNRGSGVPFLARIPIIKWLFSKRVREGRKSKLTVLIKPTIIY